MDCKETLPQGAGHSLAVMEVSKLRDLINNRPKRCLNCQTSHEVFQYTPAGTLPHWTGDGEARFGNSAERLFQMHADHSEQGFNIEWFNRAAMDQKFEVGISIINIHNNATSTTSCSRRLSSITTGAA